VTKAMVGLAFLTLVDRGEIDLDAPVADYWPDFAAEGKGDVLVRQVLGHSSGVPGWSTPVTIEDILDLERSEALLAAEKPWYEPGSASAYQIVCHGHLLDGIAHGATGRRLADVLHDDVMAAVGGGFRLGVPEDELDRCAELINPPPSSIDYSVLPPDHFLLRTVPNPLVTPAVCNTPAWRRGAVGGAGGHGTARGIALAQSAVSHGGVAAGGTRLLSEETVARIHETQAEGPDLLLMLPVRFGIGFGLSTPSAPAVPDGAAWWTGYGGAIVVNDPARRTTVAYVPNKLADHMVSSPRTDAYVRTALECLS
jgi:CubicO group peptidase (beta-lactamase class C family)